MIRTPAGRIVVIDWEFALWGDPVYDLATHLHKMAYLPDERAHLLQRWAALQSARARDGWRDDLARYLRHEWVKSAVVDSVRYAKLVADPATPAARTDALAATLAAKVAAAREVWGDPRPVDTDQVRSALLATAITLSPPAT